MTPSSATGLEAAGVSVKPLEWHPTTDEMGKNGWRFHGVSAVGPSYVATVTIHGQRGELWEVANVGLYDTIDAAKAAAQADYEARIMSALSISDGEGAVASEDGFAVRDFIDTASQLRSGHEVIRRAAMSNNFNVILAALDRASHPAPVAAQPAEGWVTVPVMPTEEQWGGLARAIVMWWSMGPRPTGEVLYKHLALTGEAIPDWLRAEIRDTDHVPPKGTVAACVYRAMLAASPTPPTAPAVPDSAVKLAVEAVEGLANGFLPGGPEDMKGALRHIVTAIRALATNPEPKL